MMVTTIRTRYRGLLLGGGDGGAAAAAATGQSTTRQLGRHVARRHHRSAGIAGWRGARPAGLYRRREEFCHWLLEVIADLWGKENVAINSLRQ